MSSVIVLNEMVVSFRDVVGGKHFSFVCGQREAGLEQQRISDLNVQHGAAVCLSPVTRSARWHVGFCKNSNALLCLFRQRNHKEFHGSLKNSHGHITLRTVTAASSKLNRAKLDAKRFTLCDFGMTLPMYTLLSETNKQLAFSLPEPASSERVSLQPSRGLCQACSEGPKPKRKL